MRLVSSASLSQSAASRIEPCEIRQLAVIDHFLTEGGTAIAQKTMEKIIASKKTYYDYGARKGGIWSEFWTNAHAPNPTHECEDRIRLTQVAEQHIASPVSIIPESVFDYPDMRDILAQEILPKMFTLISEKGWATLPEKLFAQFYLQSCSSSEAMDWHQDPGEPEWDTMADYSLVLMLGKQEDLVTGWQGGEFRIRAGKPDATETAHVKTIKHAYNQAVLFNNKLNCHRAEAVEGLETTQRDLIVTLVYLDKPPEAVPEHDHRALFAKN